MTTESDDGNLVADALTVWLNANQRAAQDHPDLVAGLQMIATQLATADAREIPALWHQYRMTRNELGDGGDAGEETFAASLRTAVLHPEDP